MFLKIKREIIILNVYRNEQISLNCRNYANMLKHSVFAECTVRVDKKCMFFDLR